MSENLQFDDHVGGAALAFGVPERDLALSGQPPPPRAPRRKPGRFWPDRRRRRLQPFGSSAPLVSVLQQLVVNGADLSEQSAQPDDHSLCCVAPQRNVIPCWI